jgi:hypothetical protein
MIIATDRVILRTWQPADCAPFAEGNRDSRVLQFMPGVLCRAESDELAARSSEYLARNGLGRYAAELRATRAYIGFIACPCRVSQRTSRLAWKSAGGWRTNIGDKDWPPKALAPQRNPHSTITPPCPGLFHRAGEPALTSRHGKTEHDVRPRRRF